MHSLKIILSKFKYFSVAWIFASLNFIIGTWVLYIPHVKEKLQLNDSEIGIALFCFALGILLFLPLVPFITKKVGLGRYSLIGVVLFATSFIFPLLAPTYILLCVSLFVAGIFVGSTDIAMNALVSNIEKKDSQNFMSAAHGFFSLGGAIGATLGSFLLAVFTKPAYHMLFIVLFVIITNSILAKNYYKIVEESVSKEKKEYDFNALKPLFIIAFIAFVIMSSEGAIEHWSGLYLKEVVGVVEENRIGFGFIFFSIMMTFGRFFADRISEKIGSLKIIFYGCIIASIGYACILISVFEITLVGFGIVGLGLSVIIPELFRVAGKTTGVKASIGISFVSGIGFIGFLLGPVLLGYISHTFSLKLSFLFLLSLTVIVFLALLMKFKQKIIRK
ncbi:MAG: MFS transporter [Polaribacter sp.]